MLLRYPLNLAHFFKLSVKPCLRNTFHKVRCNSLNVFVFLTFMNKKTPDLIQSRVQSKLKKVT